MTDPLPNLRAGRDCPIDYRISSAEFDATSPIACDTLYVVGGLYGNARAFTAIEEMAAAENARIVINGDAHWLDADPDMFRSLDARLAPHAAIRGNGETELARAGDNEAGCGCSYPPHVPDEVVARSNRMMAHLRARTRGCAVELTRLAALPKVMTARVAEARIAIVHGDATSLAGWGFGREQLDAPTAAAWLESVRHAVDADVFASTHTGTAVMRRFDLCAGALVIANNGSAGLSSFGGDPRGVVTRIATRPSPAALYRLAAKGAVVEAVPVVFDAAAWLADVARLWVHDADIVATYGARIRDGGASRLDLARPPAAEAAA